MLHTGFYFYNLYNATLISFILIYSVSGYILFFNVKSTNYLISYLLPPTFPIILVPLAIMLEKFKLIFVYLLGQVKIPTAFLGLASYFILIKV